MPEPRTREVQAECVNKRLTSVGACLPPSAGATCSGCERRPSPRKRSGAAGDRHALARAEADQVGLELSEGGQDVEEH